MKVKGIHVVLGATRIDYEDTITWAVRAFASKEKAEKHAKQAERRAKDLYQKITNYTVQVDLANEFDQNAYAIDDNLPEYYVQTILLEEEE